MLAALVTACTATAVISERIAGAASTAGPGPALISEGTSQDHGFNGLCLKGLADARAKLGVGGLAFAPPDLKEAADAPKSFALAWKALERAARAGYDPIVTCGYLLGLGVRQIAAKYPGTLFATVDSSQRQGHLKNVIGLTFADWGGGYLAGVAAAFETRSNRIGVVLGDDLDPADVSFARGYRAGALATRPGVHVRQGVALSFSNESNCRRVARDLLAHGVDVVFAAAGRCGLGALALAKVHAIWGIGVDEDQSSLGAFILTSAVKRTDVAVFTAIQARLNGTLVPGRIAAGTDLQFDAATGGIGFGRVSPRAPHRAALIALLTAVRRKLASGTIRPPRT